MSTTEMLGRPSSASLSPEVPREAPDGLAAVLFDMDGTLVDSERLWTVALGELAATYGGVLSDAARLAMVGTDSDTTMAILHEDLAQPWRDPVAGAQRLDDRVLQLFGGGLVWLPGAHELLAAVRAAGLATALVTNTGRRLVEAALPTLGWTNFDVLVCGDEVSFAKPHPEPYLAAARALGIDPRCCVAIEDSPTGIASAVAAGCAVIAVPHEVSRTEVGPTAAVVVSSLLDVDLTLLRRAAVQDLLPPLP